MKQLTVGQLIKMLSHCDPEAPLKTGKTFRQDAIVALNIDNDGKVAIISTGDIVSGEKSVRFNYGRMVTAEGIQKTGKYCM